MHWFRKGGVGSHGIRDHCSCRVLRCFSHLYLFLLSCSWWIIDHLWIVLRIPAWIPGNSFRRKAETLSMSALRGIEKPYYAVKEAIVMIGLVLHFPRSDFHFLQPLQKNGTASQSIAERIIQQQHLGKTPSYLDENIIMHISGTMYLCKSAYSF